MPDDIVKEAREAINLSYQFDKDNRREAVEDLRFVAGFQWSDSARQERQGRPLITINRSGQFLRQMSNPIRKNMPTIKVEPSSDEQQQQAEIVNGLFRRIQYNSSASHVYANAVEHMGACGIGWFRVITGYLDDESFDQEIMIKRVFNPLSVYPDPSALEPDRSDMNWCLVSELWPNEAFKNKWPGKDLASIESPNNNSAQQAISWGSADTVRVAEYWQRKEKHKTLAQLSTGDVVDIDLMQKVAPQYAEAIKPHIVNSRQVKGYTVTMTMVSGSEVLEDPYECPCKWIPVIPIIGNEVPIEQGTYRHGLIRFQREPQQLHNYFMSIAAEFLGQQPKAPYIMTPKQLGKFKTMWDNANRIPTPYLLAETDETVPGGLPQKIPPPPLPAGMVQFGQMLSDDMKATTGIYDASLGAQSNETSGVAINARVTQGDEATYHYVDNLEHGLEHLGRIILDMIPKVYDTDRMIRIKGDDHVEKTIPINKPVLQYGDQTLKINDMSKISFSSVRVILGNTIASQKQNTANIMLQLAQADPAIWQIGGDIIARNLDFDGNEELAERLHAMLPPQILQIEQQESGQPPPPPPPPDPMQVAHQQGQMQVMQDELLQSKAKTAAEQAKASVAMGQAQRDQSSSQFAPQIEMAKLQAENARTRAEDLKAHGQLLENAYKVEKIKKLREPPPEKKGTDRD